MVRFIVVNNFDGSLADSETFDTYDEAWKRAKELCLEPGPDYDPDSDDEEFRTPPPPEKNYEVEEL